jgi:hypothetical protein
MTLDRIAELLASRRFYIFILAFFVLESGWIAVSALYPQAFDENFHFGLIKVYSHYWLPFLTSQPPNANAYGAVARDPSFLFHYLMSFPYRIIALFAHSQTMQVISLRFIDVGFFGAGLVFFRRVLKRVGLSDSFSNVSLFILTLVPIVPQLAAQINYDDLLFPLVAIVCLQTFRVTDEVKRRQPSAKSLIYLLTTCLFTSLVKYAFLPMFLAIALFVVGYTYIAYRHQLDDFFKDLVTDFYRQPRWVKIGLPLLLLIGLSLFIERDGINLIKYHAVVPNCAKILSVRDCSAYSPWYYNYQTHNQVLSGQSAAHDNIFIYTGQWFYWMWYRLFFAVNGMTSGFANYPPLPLPSIAAILIALVSIVATIKWRRLIFRNRPYLLLLLTICFVYMMSLFFKGYATYKYTAVLENMNGRYLIPVLPLLAAIGGSALSFALRHSRTQRVVLTIVIVLLFLQGGGVLTFMIRSDSTWYFSNRTVNKVNSTAHKITTHVVVKGKKPTVTSAPAVSLSN